MSRPKLHCAYTIAKHHSLDRVSVLHGRAEATILCGYHASEQWLETVLASLPPADPPKERIYYQLLHVKAAEVWKTLPVEVVMATDPVAACAFDESRLDLDRVTEFRVESFANAKLDQVLHTVQRKPQQM